MTPQLRWRIAVLQIALVVVLAFVSGFLFWASNFTHSYVHDELVAQKITFPAAGNAALTALPAADAKAMSQYAGQSLENGDQAQTYANHFIAVHLREIGGGLTYSQVSTKAMAAPKDAKLSGEKSTLFQGETLRGLLLNAWGWWTVGTYALYAAIGLTVATLAVFATFIYEVFFAGAKETAAAVSSRSSAPLSAHI